MNFLGLEGKTILVMGLANRKSVAWAVAQTLEEQGARVVFSVRTERRLNTVKRLVGDRPVYVCDVENADEIKALAESVKAEVGTLHGVVHSIAFANFSEGIKPFHETKREDYLQATQISCFSLVEIARVMKPILDPKASVVTIGISSLLVTAENYGCMSPIKAALDSAVRQLAKSFSSDTEVRFNAVCPGLLKTSASAGIPGYIESYIYGEKMTFRKRALATQEVANTVVFLLSERSSGMNGSSVIIDAGLGQNYFDKELIRLAMRPENGDSQANE